MKVQVIKATLSKIIKGAIEYIYPKTDAGVVNYEDSDVQNELDRLDATKVDANGKVLSSNNFSNELRDKLDGIENEANNYKLPAANNYALGGFKVGYKDNEEFRMYGVKLDDENRMYITVPWTNINLEMLYPLVNYDEDGLMTSEDKKKLDSIEYGANNYKLPAADENTFGGVKIGASDGVDPVYALTNGQYELLEDYFFIDNDNRDYPVKLDENNRAYIHVPWEDTSYPIVSENNDGLMSKNDKEFLDKITSEDINRLGYINRNSIYRGIEISEDDLNNAYIGDYFMKDWLKFTVAGIEEKGIRILLEDEIGVEFNETELESVKEAYLYDLACVFKVEFNVNEFRLLRDTDIFGSGIYSKTYGYKLPYFSYRPDRLITGENYWLDTVVNRERIYIDRNGEPKKAASYTSACIRYTFLLS